VAATVVALSSPRLALQALPLGLSLGPGLSDVEMRFERADRLAPGAEVRYGERLVGRVDTVGTDGSDAVVGVRLEAETGVPADVVAEIRLPTALGTPYVALTPPRDGATAEKLEDSRLVPRARTGAGPGLEASLAAPPPRARPRPAAPAPAPSRPGAGPATPAAPPRRRPARRAASGSAAPGWGRSRWRWRGAAPSPRGSGAAASARWSCTRRTATTA